MSARSFELLIANVTVVAGPAPYEVLTEHAIGISGDRIVDISPMAALSDASATRTLDAHGMIAFPGLTNTHTHLFQTLLKGLGDEMYLIPWAAATTVPSAIALEPEEAYMGAVLGCLDAIRSGTTTILDFAYPSRTLDIYEGIMRGFDAIGVRGFIGRGISVEDPDGAGRTQLQLPLDEILDGLDTLLERFPTDLPTPRILPAPSTVRGMNREALGVVREFANRRGLRMTIHLNEIVEDNPGTLERYGEGSVPFLEGIGFLGPDVIAAHCVQLDETDIEILARTGTRISYNPVSNFYLGNGIAPIVALLRAGASVSLATDGAASNNSQDMVEALKFAALAQKGAAKDPRVMDARGTLRLAAEGGAAALGLQDHLGTLEVGKLADLFLFDPYHAKSVPVHDPISTLVYSSSEQNVDTVLIGGKVVLEHGTFVDFDEASFLKEVQERAVALSKRAGTRHIIETRMGRVPALVG